jgi:hypothetical protein
VEFLRTEKVSGCCGAKWGCLEALKYYDRSRTKLEGLEAVESAGSSSTHHERRGRVAANEPTAQVQAEFRGHDVEEDGRRSTSRHKAHSRRRTSRSSVHAQEDAQDVGSEVKFEVVRNMAGADGTARCSALSPLVCLRLPQPRLSGARLIVGLPSAIWRSTPKILY